jgi:hypothetical protein
MPEISPRSWGIGIMIPYREVLMLEVEEEILLSGGTEIPSIGPAISI